MMHINLVPEAPEADRETSPEQASLDFDHRTCPGCLGKGRYEGFLSVEDPCRFCDGSGLVSPDSESPLQY